jgi:hypothetical protein
MRPIDDHREADDPLMERHTIRTVPAAAATTDLRGYWRPGAGSTLP